ncbi:helix-turn-helix transcriptional regulator [Cellvibrio mixtus]|uniref:helix-turn-helix transcriptional regulator n=1 Tax=Cellvibrio mixtus TaxID=39650 RepID=UPI000587A06D|nr:hypothetical protein [Cellvibrio mixtus]
MSHYEPGDYESQLISRIYEAALDPGLWSDVLQSITDACGAHQSTLFFYNAQCRARNFAVAAKTCGGIIEKYLREFIDVEAARMHIQLSRLKEGELATPTGLFRVTGGTYEDLVGAEYMETFMPELQFCAGIILLHDNMTCSGLGIRKHTGSSGLDSSAEEFLRRITPHMVQAIKIHDHLSSIKQVNQAIKEVLKRINQGVFLLDRNLRVIFSNAEAARVLESHAVLEIGRQGKLYLTGDKENQQLQSVFQRLIRPPQGTLRKSRKAVSLAAGTDFQSKPLRLTITPVDTRAENELSKEGIAIAVFVSDPDRPGNFSDAYMQQAYALTPTECNIMKALLKNKNIGDIAEMRGTTLETARSQLKIILQKTGTHSQVELSRLLVALDNDV